MSFIARSAEDTRSRQSYKAQGYAATAECLIDYLMLDEENDARRLVGRSKCNPPLRPRAEVEKLWRRLAAGDVVSRLNRRCQLVA